jgi:large subunit ribosomal protein L37e
MGKRNKTTHVMCRRCGKRTYHTSHRVCSSCGFGKSATMKKFAWQTKKTTGERKK